MRRTTTPARRALGPALAILVVALIAGPVAEAGAVRKRSPRVVRESYAPNPYEGLAVNHGEPGVSVTSIPVPLRADENFVSVKLTDDSGAAVRGAVYQQGAMWVQFCGQTDEPLLVDPAKDLSIEVVAGPCDGGVSIPTEGSLEVKIFSR